jgi:hypothetical protein
MVVYAVNILEELKLKIVNRFFTNIRNLFQGRGCDEEGTVKNGNLMNLTS